MSPHPTRRLALLALILASCRPATSSPPAGESAGAEPARAVFVEAQPGPDAPEHPLADPRAPALFRCWFRAPYEYMFAGQATLEVNGRHFGMLQAGINGILYYGGLNDCAAELTGTESRSYSDIHPIEEFLGVPAVRTDAAIEDFDAVNPEFVAAGRRLLLDPSTSVDGVSVVMAYRLVFQRFFRLMAESLMVLLERPDISAEREAYLRATRSGAYGVEWLEGHYGGQLSQYGGGWDGTTMTPPMAFGFWLRREADGSLGDCWHGLRDLLERYDRPWLEATLGDYPIASGKLARIPDPLLDQP